MKSFKNFIEQINLTGVPKDKMYTVYGITPVGKRNPKYVGYTERLIKRRYQWHCGKANLGRERPLYVAIRKYGKDNLIIKDLFYTNDLEIALEIEQHFIDMYDTYNNGWNTTPDGRGGRSKIEIKEEEIRKMKKSFKNFKEKLDNDILSTKKDIVVPVAQKEILDTGKYGVRGAIFNSVRNTPVVKEDVVEGGFIDKNGNNLGHEPSKGDTFDGDLKRDDENIVDPNTVTFWANKWFTGFSGFPISAVSSWVNSITIPLNTATRSAIELEIMYTYGKREGSKNESNLTLQKK